jgi:hypothetical protein
MNCESIANRLQVIEVDRESIAKRFQSVRKTITEPFTEQVQSDKKVKIVQIRMCKYRKALFSILLRCRRMEVRNLNFGGFKRPRETEIVLKGKKVNLECFLSLEGRI